MLNTLGSGFILLSPELQWNTLISIKYVIFVHFFFFHYSLDLLGSLFKIFGEVLLR